MPMGAGSEDQFLLRATGHRLAATGRHPSFVVLCQGQNIAEDTPRAYLGDDDA